MQDFIRSKMYKQSIYMTLIAVVDKQKGSTICPPHSILVGFHLASIAFTKCTICRTN